MEVTIREMDSADRATWADMRASLWPDELRDEEGIDVFLGRKDTWGFV
ncbi:MAG TPA: hypothetical protein VGF60_15705 [Xanthobacteraceae bacterium]|jgi:hypothetical protein